jgi:hydrogenase maturation protease
MRPGSILVIGYGNDLRGDDAAGRCAATRIAAWELPAVRVLSLHQLTPELADPLAAADRAIFLDAHPVADDPAVRVRPISPLPHTNRFGHTSDPQALLAFTQIAFGRIPEAWWVTIPAADFALGEPLSRFAERGIADALAAIRPLLDPRISQDAETLVLAQAAQKGSDARRRAQGGVPTAGGSRRTTGTPQRVPEQANAADGPFSAAC